MPLPDGRAMIRSSSSIACVLDSVIFSRSLWSSCCHALFSEAVQQYTGCHRAADVGRVKVHWVRLS
jgi:hypothetical protein